MKDNVTRPHRQYATWNARQSSGTVRAEDAFLEHVITEVIGCGGALKGTGDFRVDLAGDLSEGRIRCCTHGLKTLPGSPDIGVNADLAQEIVTTAFGFLAGHAVAIIPHIRQQVLKPVRRREVKVKLVEACYAKGPLNKVRWIAFGPAYGTPFSLQLRGTPCRVTYTALEPLDQAPMEGHNAADLPNLKPAQDGGDLHIRVITTTPITPTHRGCLLHKRAVAASSPK